MDYSESECESYLFPEGVDEGHNSWIFTDQTHKHVHQLIWRFQSPCHHLILSSGLWYTKKETN